MLRIELNPDMFEMPKCSCSACGGCLVLTYEDDSYETYEARRNRLSNICDTMRRLGFQELGSGWSRTTFVNPFNKDWVFKIPRSCKGMQCSITEHVLAQKQVVPAALTELEWVGGVPVIHMERLAQVYGMGSHLHLPDWVRLPVCDGGQVGYSVRSNRVVAYDLGANGKAEDVLRDGSYWLKEP